jgi:hypothetical protein
LRVGVAVAGRGAGRGRGSRSRVGVAVARAREARGARCAPPQASPALSAAMQEGKREAKLLGAGLQAVGRY